MAGYIDWQSARYGRISVRRFCKLPLMDTLHGMACATTVAATP